MQRSSSSSIVRVDGASYSSLPDEVFRLPYFHREISSMQDVFAIVNKYINYDGHFLLRQSFTKPGTLTVSVLHGRGVKHFNVAKQHGDYFLKDKLFHTINDLIVHYRTHDVPNVEGITNVRLITPIVSQDSETISVKESYKLPGNNFQSQDQSYSSRMSPHSTGNGKNRSIISSVNKPFLMHEKKQILSNSLCQSSISLPNDFKCSNESISSFTSTFNNSPDYLFGRLPPNKSSVRCRQRIPQPVPSEAAANLYYSTVRDPDKELAPNLIKMLCEVENNEDEKCVCGLLYEEAELIMGWTMHLSTEPESKGKLFFMGPDGETAWQLPIEVFLNLSTDHQTRIQELSQNTI